MNGVISMRGTIPKGLVKNLKELKIIVRIMIIQTTVSGYACGVMVKALDCGIVVSEFELQACYYVHFRINTFDERYEPTSYGLYRITAVLREG